MDKPGSTVGTVDPVSASCPAAWDRGCGGSRSGAASSRRSGSWRASRASFVIVASLLSQAIRVQVIQIVFELVFVRIVNEVIDAAAIGLNCGEHSLVFP